MAQLVLDHPRQTRDRLRRDGEFRQMRHGFAGVLRVKEGDLRPGRQIDEDLVRHRQQTGAEFAPELPALPQQRHDVIQRDGAVEIGAAQPDAVAGQDLDPGPADPEQREIRGAAADIDDQTKRRAGQIGAGAGGGLGLGAETDLGKARRREAAGQIGQRPGIAAGIGVEMHRSARKHAGKAQAGLRLGAGFRFRQKGGDDLGQGAAAPADRAGFMEQGRAQNAFERAHEAALLARDQRRNGGGTDPHRPRLGRKEDRGGQGVGGAVQRQATHPPPLHEGGGGIRRAEVDRKRKVGHRRPL